MNMPNKVTIVAAAIYAVSSNPEVKNKPLWTALSDQEKKPFLTASEFLASYAHGSDFHVLDRAKTAASFEAQCGDMTVNANTAVEVFLTISSLLG